MASLICSPFLLLKFRVRASRDYRLARGTLHLKQIESALRNLSSRIHDLQDELSSINAKIQELEEEEKEELRETFLRQVVPRELRNVPGIGSTLAEDILDRCFDGTLWSLKEAYLYVRGVGEKRQAAINDWVQSLEWELSSRLEKDFPGKKEVDERYKRHIADLKTRQVEVNKELESLKELGDQVEEKVQWLRQVRPRLFFRAYRGNKEASALVTKYLMGVFAEWEEMPEWFKKLIGDFGYDVH